MPYFFFNQEKWDWTTPSEHVAKIFCIESRQVQNYEKEASRGIVRFQFLDNGGSPVKVQERRVNQFHPGIHARYWQRGVGYEAIDNQLK